MFYLFATACGKSLPKRNAKYWFNYIIRSLLLKSLNRSVSSKFVIEVMSFLNRPEAQSFIHKDANVTCFVELVKLQSNRLTSEAWQQIAECRARYFGSIVYLLRKLERVTDDGVVIDPIKG